MNRGGLAAAGGHFPRNMPQPNANNNAGRKLPEGEWRRSTPPAAAATGNNTANTRKSGVKSPQADQPTVDADGFTIASGSLAARQQQREQQQQAQAAAAKAKKEEEAKGKFSFASVKGLVEDQDEEDVEQVTEGVKAVNV